MTDEKYTHFIAVDFGTAGCGIAVKIDPPASLPASLPADETRDEHTPISDIHIFQKWLPNKSSIKCPTIMLLDHKLDCIAFGLQARQHYKRAMKDAKRVENLYLFEYFKMSLYKHSRVRSYIRRLVITTCRKLNSAVIPA